MKQVVEFCWLAMAVYWLIGASQTKAAKASEGPLRYWLRMGFLVLLFEFLFSDWGRWGWLGRRWVPATATASWIGLGVVLAGLSLAVWARHYLGRNWSSAVMLKQEHTLVGRGPYRWIRHPIYTGMAVGLLGTAMVIGEWRAVVGFVAVLAAHVFKARQEERWLGREFGAAFEAHRRRTGMFLPRFSRE